MILEKPQDAENGEASHDENGVPEDGAELLTTVFLNSTRVFSICLDLLVFLMRFHYML